MHFHSKLQRRQILQGAGILAAQVAVPALAQPGKSAGNARTLSVAQVVDYSLTQQDVSKDFLIGARAAWQDINARGGLRGKTVRHLTLETDGTAASVRAALDKIKDDPSCVVLSGTVGDQVASQVVAQLSQDKLAMAHAAPWLQNSSLAIDEQTFPIFAARQQQITYALKTLSSMGLKELGAVYASSQDQTVYREDVERIAGSMGLKLLSLRGSGDLGVLGQKLTPTTPAVLLFLGGTPELAQFTQGLGKQARQRYIVALADVNIQTMLQMGGARTTPVIAIQVVPLVNASLPVVRTYRETLGRLFDEPPVPLSLAGFIAARYTHDVLSAVNGPLTRQTALAEFQRRADVDVGGFRISYDAQRRSATYVTQSMTTADGRLVG
jgi:ABC-type branched-subunit amino acid transport system substrate-binding protein